MLIGISISICSGFGAVGFFGRGVDFFGATFFLATAFFFAGFLAAFLGAARLVNFFFATFLAGFLFAAGLFFAFDAFLRGADFVDLRRAGFDFFLEAIMILLEVIRNSLFEKSQGY